MVVERLLKEAVRMTDVWVLTASVLTAVWAVPGGRTTLGAEDNPIHITFVIHFDPLPAPGGRVLREGYEAERDNLQWLADYLEQLEQMKGKEFVPRLTLEMAGDHAEWYLEDERGLSLLKRLCQKGIHSLGTHFHTNYKEGKHLWPALPHDWLSPQTTRRVTQDHVAEVDRLIGKIINSDDRKAIRKANRTITGHFMDQKLAEQMGFEVQTGGRNEAMNLFFDHDVYNPWRPGFGWPLAEDLDNKRWVVIPQAPVLGAIGEHCPIPRGVPEQYTRGMRMMIWQDVSAAAMKRKFLHLYLERRHSAPSTPHSARDKVSVFGWHEHTGDLHPDDAPGRFRRKYRGAVVEFVQWLNAHFIGRKTADGRPLARYCNVDTARLTISEEPVIVASAQGAIQNPQSNIENSKGRVPIQFRMNVNYFPDEAVARENCRMLRRHLDLFRHAGVKASYWFTGLAADQIQRIDPEFIRLLNEAGMPVAHHGANRPPNPQPIHRVQGEKWEDDVQAILDCESYAIDPRTGAPDKTKVGGLKRMQEMFGNRIAVTGRFFEASILYATKQFGCRAMIGLGDNTGASSNAGWFLGMMGMPDARSVGPEMLRAAARGKLDLFRFIDDSATRQPSQEVQSIAVLIHDHDFLQGSPALPQHGFLRGSAALQQQLWETYAKLIQWAAKHPRLRVVTFQEILDQIADDRTKSVPRAAVVKAAETVAASRAAPPEFIRLDGDYLSLADTFQAFAFSLADFAQSGKLPERVTAGDILGPTRYRPAGKPVRGAIQYAQDTMQLRREGRLTIDPARIPTTPKPQSVDLEVSGERVITIAKSLDLGKEIPASIEVNGGEVNPAVFLQLMAQTVKNLNTSDGPGTVRVSGQVNVLPVQVQQNMLADSLTKLQFWTYKPERWKENEE